MRCLYDEFRMKKRESDSFKNIMMIVMVTVSMIYHLYHRDPLVDTDEIHVSFPSQQKPFLLHNLSYIPKEKEL